MKESKKATDVADALESIADQELAAILGADVQEEKMDGVYEIFPGMTAEEMRAMFFDRDALIEPPYKVFQLNSKRHRYYYRFEDGEPVFYPSVTTILSQTMPQSPHLIKWIADMGYDEAERYKNERAAYGTFMHAQFEELIIARTYDLDGLKGRLKKYIEQQELPSDFIYYADDLKKDVLAFAQFVKDYDVRPLAVEIALVDEVHGYAGMIDLPCNMLLKPGKEERVNAIIDFKSGKKGFYEDYVIQLHMYKDMWNLNFPDYPINRVYNFAPKDWRKTPTYNIKDQTDDPAQRKIPALLELAAIEDEKVGNEFTICTGGIDLDSDAGLEGNILKMTLAELVKKKAPEKAPEKAGTESQVEKKAPEEPKKAEKKEPKAKKETKKAGKAPKKAAEPRKTTKGAVTPKRKENGTDARIEENNKHIDLLNEEPEI